LTCDFSANDSFYELSIIHWVTEPRSLIEAEELNGVAANEQSFGVQEKHDLRRMVAGTELSLKKKRTRTLPYLFSVSAVPMRSD
jgi:hypothetical protein